jgi:hypothetical protein
MCRKDNFEHQIQKITKISEYCHFLAVCFIFFAIVKNPDSNRNKKGAQLWKRKYLQKRSWQVCWGVKS